MAVGWCWCNHPAPYYPGYAAGNRARYDLGTRGERVQWVGLGGRGVSGDTKNETINQLFPVENGVLPQDAWLACMQP